MNGVCPLCQTAFVDGDKIVVFNGKLYCTECKQKAEALEEEAEALKEVEIPTEEMLQIKINDGTVSHLMEEWCVVTREEGDLYSDGCSTLKMLNAKLINFLVDHFQDDDYHIVHVLKLGKPVPFITRLEVIVDGMDLSNYELTK